MFKKAKEMLKGVKRFMDEKVKAMANFISSRQNRITLGYIIFGLGVGLGVGLGGALIASGYAKPSSFSD